MIHINGLQYLSTWTMTGLFSPIVFFKSCLWQRISDTNLLSDHSKTLWGTSKPSCVGQREWVAGAYKIPSRYHSTNSASCYD